MAGFIGQALSVLLKENECIVAPARVLGGVVACRVHKQEETRNLLTGETVYRWVVEFKNDEDLQMFDTAIREIVECVTGEGK